MPRYTVKARYAAERGGREITQFGPWAPGDEVELDDPVDADWVNRDAGSTILVPAKEKAAAKKAPAKEKAAEGDAHSSADAGLTKG